MRDLYRASAALSAKGMKHVMVIAGEPSQAETFLDLAVPNDYELWGKEIPKILKGLDPKATDSNIKSALQYVIKNHLPRLFREHGTKYTIKQGDWEGFFRDRIDEIREMFNTAHSTKK